MKRIESGFTRLAALLMFSMSLLLPMGPAFAETYVWTGAEDGYWTNAANWTLSGATASRCPGVALEADMSVVWANWSNDVSTASFSGASERTTIDLDGLFSVPNIVFSGASTPVYTLGNGDQLLPLNPRSTLTVASDVVNMPILPARVSLGIGADQTDNKTPVDSVTFVNEAAGRELVFDNLGYLLKNPQFTTYVATTLIFDGAGDFRVKGKLQETLGSKINVTFGQTGTVSFESDVGIFRSYRFEENANVHLEKGSRLRVDDGYNTFYAFSGTKVYGEGVFDISSVNNCSLVTSSKHPEIACTVTNAVRTRYKALPVSAYTATEEYHLHLSATNNFFGVPIWFKGYPGGMHVVLNRIGLRADGGVPEMALFGAATGKSGDGGAIAYAGPGEVTDRVIRFSPATSTDFLPVASTDDAYARLENSATGTWRVRSPLQSDTTGKLFLTLIGESAETAIYETAISNVNDSVLSLNKRGSGIWRLEGPCTYTGSTVVSGGTLVFAGEALPASTSGFILREGGATLRFERADGVETALTKVNQHYGANNTIEVTGDGLFKIDTLVVENGSLNLVPLDDAEIRVPAGADLSKVMFKGVPATADENGVVGPSADHVLAIRGDTLPDDEGASAVFALAGSGEADVLGADTVRLGSLVQMFSSAPAEVAIGEGQVLSVSAASVAKTGADLVLGVESGKGTVTAPGDLTLSSAQEGACVAINADVAVASDKAISITGGDVVLGGGMKTPSAIVQTAGTLTLTGTPAYAVGPIQMGDKSGTDTLMVLDGVNVVQGDTYAAVGYHGKRGAGVARLVLTNSTWISTRPFGETPTSADANIIQIGRSPGGDNSGNGILEICAGTLVSNRIALAGHPGEYGQGVNGAIWQSGGTVVLDGDNANGTQIGGVYGTGFYHLTGGTLIGTQKLGIGNNWAYFLQEGGTVEVRSLDDTAKAPLYLQESNGFAGFYRMTGGKASCSALSLSVTYLLGSHSALIVDGKDAVFETGNVNAFPNVKDDEIPKIKSADTNIANIVLNAGVMQANGFYCRKHPSITAVGFGGGTLKLGTDGVDVFHLTPAYVTALPVDAVTVYGGGATIDTAGHTGCRSSVPIIRPHGKGVVGVRNFAPITDANRIVPPIIKVYGDGTGAVAVAKFDFATRTVTGVEILQGGFGYTHATFFLHDRGPLRVVTFEAELGDVDSSGSFTKAGAGDLTLAAANTWGGDTVLAGGTLKLDDPAALPEGTTLVFQGGTVDANENPLPTAYAIDGAAVAANGGAFAYDGAFAFPEGSTFALRNAEALTNDMKSVRLVTFTGGITGNPALADPGLKDWKLIRSGNSFRFSYRKGLLMIVR